MSVKQSAHAHTVAKGGLIRQNKCRLPVWVCKRCVGHLNHSFLIITERFLVIITLMLFTL